MTMFLYEYYPVLHCATPFVELLRMDMTYCAREERNINIAFCSIPTCLDCASSLSAEHVSTYCRAYMLTIAPSSLNLDT